MIKISDIIFPQIETTNDETFKIFRKYGMKHRKNLNIYVKVKKIQ